MKCKKCGSDVLDTAKFCIYCGEKLGELNNLSSQMIESADLNESNIGNVYAQSNMTNNDVQQNGTQQMQQNISSQIKEIPSSQSQTGSTNKKNNAWIFVIGSILLGAIVVLLLFFAFNNSSSNSLQVLQKALNNVAEKGKDNGTINASLIMESEMSDAINLTATIKYAKKLDSYDVAFTLNKSLLFDEMNLYSTVTDKDVTLYAKSSLVDMLGMTSSTTDLWLYYLLSLDDLDIEEELDKVEDNLDLSKILDNNHYKFIDEKDGLRHYQLIIDNELLKKAEKLTESSETINPPINEISEEEMKLDQPINLDFYINKYDELVKISIDMSKFIDYQSFSKLAFEISFADFGNTKVVIPEEAKKSTMNFETYMSTYASSTGFDTSSDTDLDTDFGTEFDTNLGTDFDFNF